MSSTSSRSEVLFRTRRVGSALLALSRLIGVAFHIMYGMLLACIFPILNLGTRKYILKHWSRSLLEVLRVGLDVQGTCHPETLQGCLLLANHISWLDVIAMNAVIPACFVAKSEVRSWPLLGWMCQRAGTLFIRRNIRRDTARINHEIADALKRGECVALFPEGTSTDGELPSHFHSSLLQGALNARSVICPVAVRYHDGAGRANSDAAFVGDMSFLQSLWNILCSRSLHVTLYYLPPLPCAGKNRRLLAVNAQGAIHMALANFSPNHSVQVPSGGAPFEWQRRLATPLS